MISNANQAELGHFDGTLDDRNFEDFVSERDLFIKKHKTEKPISANEPLPSAGGYKDDLQLFLMLNSISPKIYIAD